MRSRTSDADEHLIARLAGEGFTVSPSQLERWRGRGLIDRATVVRASFGGSRVLEHPESVFEACRLLAQVSTRGRQWQYSAIDLFDAGGTLSTPAVRGAAAFMLRLQEKPFRRAWRLAEAGAEPVVADPGEWLADVATAAAARSGRRVRRMVRDDIRPAHPKLSAPQLREATERALIWRIADICAPMYLTEEQRRWARHGLDEPLDPLSALLPLPSERAACVATLTWSEARLARHELILEENPLLEVRWALDLASWRVTIWRMFEDFAHPERPLSDEALSRISRDLEEEYFRDAKESLETPPEESAQHEDD